LQKERKSQLSCWKVERELEPSHSSHLMIMNVGMGEHEHGASSWCVGIYVVALKACGHMLGALRACNLDVKKELR